MDSPTKEDIVMAVRIKQGRAEFELLVSKPPAGNIKREQARKELIDAVCLAWDAWTEAKETRKGFIATALRHAC
jgi:hypothetical protein